MCSMSEVSAEGLAQYEAWRASQLEGPFTYRSGWTGFYDPVEGRYLDTNDIYMPRDFDPAEGR